MNRYGQVLDWSTINAPHVFSGTCTDWSYEDGTQRQPDEDEGGDIAAVIEHSRKAAIQFSAKVRKGTDDFLDLSTGAAVAINGITGGAILAYRTEEKWALGQPKTCSVSATHFPNVVLGTGALAGTGVDAFVPTQTGLTIVHPGETMIYGTHGLSHAAGVVHELTITQTLTLTEDEPSPTGAILGVAAHGYHQEIGILLLANATNPPAPGDPLGLVGAPDRVGSFLIERVAKRQALKRGKFYQLTAIWIPPFAE